jgi:hypothetical protein
MRRHAIPVIRLETRIAIKIRSADRLQILHEVHSAERRPMSSIDPNETLTVLDRTPGLAVSDLQSFLAHLLSQSLPMDQKPAMH